MQNYKHLDTYKVVYERLDGLSHVIAQYAHAPETYPYSLKSGESPLDSRSDPTTDSITFIFGDSYESGFPPLTVRFPENLRKRFL